MQIIGNVIVGMNNRSGLPDCIRDTETGRILEWDEAAAGFAWMGYIVPPWYVRQHPLRFRPHTITKQLELAV